MARLVALSLFLMLVGSAEAQTPVPAPPESVTVSGTRSRDVIQDFAHSFAAPTHFIGKIARWERGICPVAVGMPDDANAFVIARLKEVAAKAGAPISTDTACKHNIEIVFTHTPQALLDNVKKDQEDFLGYHDSPAQRDKLAAVTHPIQAWYTTATQDLKGVLQVDASQSAKPGRGLMLQLPCALLGNAGGPAMGAGALCTEYLPGVRKYESAGFKTRDGLRSDFYNIIIVADIGKIGGLELDSVSDYIAMLALTQPGSLDACPPLSSIISLLAKDCDSHAERLTDADFAYLDGAYKMNPEMALGLQQRQIADWMQQAPPGK